MLIRHGPTEYNEKKLIQGHIDVPLSEAGACLIRNYKIPLQLNGFSWVSSPLIRALTTAETISSCKVIVEPSLIEMNWGTWEGQCLAELRQRLGSKMRENEDRGWDFIPPNGESPRQVLCRLKPWFQKLVSHQDNTVAVTHKGVIRVILATALDWNLLGPCPLKLDWTCAHIFHIDKKGVIQLLSPNITLLHPSRNAIQTKSEN